MYVCGAAAMLLIDIAQWWEPPLIQTLAVFIQVYLTWISDSSMPVCTHNLKYVIVGRCAITTCKGHPYKVTTLGGGGGGFGRVFRPPAKSWLDENWMRA